jgi:prepilin peptidase CpaA
VLNLPVYFLLLPAIPIGIYVAWSDMKFMRIPNVACYALFISFLVLAPLIFGMQEYGFRILQGIAVLIGGFFATNIGLVGGGDSKFAAAMAPFIALSEILPFIFIIGIMSFVSIGLHKLVGVTPGLKNMIKDWDSWNAHGMFPFGVTLAGSLIAYLLLNLWQS